MDTVEKMLEQIEENTRQILENRRELLGEDPFRRAAAARLNRSYAETNLALWGKVADALELEALAGITKGKASE
jgi:hypothetical protein